MRLLRRFYFVLILVLVLICGIFLIDFLRAPSLTPYRPTPNYITYSTISVKNGKYKNVLAFRTNYKGLGIDSEKSEEIQGLLVQKMQTLLDEEKRVLKGHDSSLAGVETSIIDEDDIVGYVITFSSFDIFEAYCNTLHREIKEGTFIDKITQTAMYPLTSEDEAAYKKIVVDAVASVAGDDISESYSPIFYYEYVENSQGRANAQQIQRDSQGYTHYIWLSEKVDKAQTLVLKINKINYWVWIVVGLFLPLAVMFLVIAIIIKPRGLATNQMFDEKT